jgi:hypothetical protein
VLVRPTWRRVVDSMPYTTASVDPRQDRPGGVKGILERWAEKGNSRCAEPASYTTALVFASCFSTCYPVDSNQNRKGKWTIPKEKKAHLCVWCSTRRR